MNLRSRRPRPILLAILGATVAFGAGVAIFHSSSATATPDQTSAIQTAQAADSAAVQKVATDAIVLQQTIGLSAGNTRQLRAQMNADTSNVPEMPPASAVEAALASGKVDIATEFDAASSALRARETLGLTNTVNEQRDPNFRSIGRGVSKVVYQSTTVTGITAKTVSLATIWASSMVRQPGTTRWIAATPTNVLTVTTTLTKVGTVWKVSDMVADFTPDTTP